MLCSHSGMWRCTWFHWTPAGPVRFTVVQRWSRSPRWVSTKASAFLSLQTPWRCVPCSCRSARWDLRLRRNYWYCWRNSDAMILLMSDSLNHSENSTIKLSVWKMQGTTQVSLADCEGSAEMVYHWLRVQMLSGTELPRPDQKNLCHRRHQEGHEDEQRPRAMVNTHTPRLCLFYSVYLKKGSVVTLKVIWGVGTRRNGNEEEHWSV